MTRACIFGLLVAFSIDAVGDTLGDAVSKDLPSLLALYRDLHANPELSFQETKTAAKLAAEMKRLGFTVTTGVGKTGLVAVLKNGEGPVLMLRTDMDALPVLEQTGLPYASKAKTMTQEGREDPVMHACGHDMHMTAWIGAARRLVAVKNQWAGTLMMIAQPAEELGQGATAMLEDGLYTRFSKPQAAIALHDSAALPAGTVGYTEGYVLATVDGVEITVRGVGGHGAYPHTTKDPIVLGARIVSALQTLVSRENDPQQPAVVTVGSFHAGTRNNIIPDEAKLLLTVRSYAPETRRLLLEGIARIARGEAIAAGMPEDRMPLVVVSDKYLPATFNTQPLTQQIVEAFIRQFGKERVVKVPAVMGGEDFSQYRLADPTIQSLIFWVGGVPKDQWAQSKGDAQKLPSLHSPFWAPDAEPTILAATQALTVAALRVLQQK